MRQFWSGYWYTVERSGDGWMVIKDGSDEIYAVRTFPPYCTCGDYEFRRNGDLPLPCKHVRLVREALNAATGANAYANRGATVDRTRSDAGE